MGCNDEDLVLIHDGVRLLSQEIISQISQFAKLYGYAITGIQCREAILESGDGFTSTTSIHVILLFALRLHKLSIEEYDLGHMNQLIKRYLNSGSFLHFVGGT